MSDQFIGQTLADKYKIEAILRQRDAETIFRGTHLLMEKPVLIKVLSPDLAANEDIVAKYSAEAKIVSRLSHPNILNVTDFGKDAGGAIYTVMEGIEGENLENAIQRDKKLSVERAVRITRQIAAALSAAHSSNLVHGNLNSENILLARGLRNVETVKVFDFGSLTIDGNEIARENFEYLAPEQLSDLPETNERSDIYALGVIFYEMLAGEVPFSAANPGDLAAKQTQEPPAPLSAFRQDLPSGIEPIILRALSRTPENRHQSAAEFIEELNRETLFSGDQETVVVPPVQQTETSNNLWKTAFIVLIGICALAGAFIYATSVKQREPATQMQTDANGVPVQPINPATGMNELGLMNTMPAPSDLTGNSNMQMPEAMPGGDGYNPWDRGGIPPPGAPPPYPVAPGGEVYSLPSNGTSVFMQDGESYILVPANTNANVQPSPQKTPRGTQANTQPSPPPDANVSTPETKPTPAKTPQATPKPTEKPKENTPPPTEKREQSGKQQDTD